MSDRYKIEYTHGAAGVLDTKDATDWLPGRRVELTELCEAMNQRDELLAVCRSLDDFQKTFEKNTYGNKMPGNEHYRQLLMAIVEDARRAIARATGEDDTPPETAKDGE